MIYGMTSPEQTDLVMWNALEKEVDTEIKRLSSAFSLATDGERERYPWNLKCSGDIGDIGY